MLGFRRFKDISKTMYETEWNYVAIADFLLAICGALLDLVPCGQFHKRERYPWRSVEACNFTKSNTPPWMFFTFFKLYECYQIAQRITYENYPQLNFCCYLLQGDRALKVAWPFKRQPQKMVKHTQTVRRQFADHFVGLALKGFKLLLVKGSFLWTGCFYEKV